MHFTSVLSVVLLLVIFSHAKVIQKGSKKSDDTGDKPKVAALTDDGKLSDTTKKKLLSETNRFRLMHDATPLGICPVCSDAAQIHADEIAKSGVVKPDHKAKYGQIIFSTKDQQDIEPGADYFGTLVPARIYNQIKNYDFVKNEFKDNAADFTQLVWEGSEVIGFASSKSSDNTVYVVMYFNPAGNNDSLSYYENVNRVTGAGDIEASGRMKCLDGWDLHGSSCFKYFEDEMSWPDAVDHCNVLKSSLTSAECMDEGTYIRTMMMEKEKPAWIGMSDTATKGGFQFVDGAPYVYSDWSYDSYTWLYAHPGEARGKCITAGKDGWNYKDCNEKLGFICKMRPNGMTSYSLDLYFPGSSFTNDLSMPGSKRYDIMKATIDKAFNTSYGSDIWFVGDTFYQFMPRDNGEVAASTLIKFAPDIRAPVDPITKLRNYLREQSDLKILAVRLIPGIGRVTSTSVSGGTCPSGCSGDCYPECNPVCCGAAVSLSAPAVPSGYTACAQYPACGSTCQPSCSQQCCQQNPYQTQQQAPQQQQCPQYPGCSASCAPSCTQSCCQQQQQQQTQAVAQQQACPQYPRCSPSCAPSCSQSCCQQQQQQPQAMMPVQQPMQQACPQNPGCSPTCAPRCSPSCCQRQQQYAQTQAISGSMVIPQMMMAPPPPPPPPMNACSGMYPGCSSACAPACRPTCCGMRTFGGKKRSKVDKVKLNKKNKIHRKKSKKE